jgi:hypothetical protein
MSIWVFTCESIKANLIVLSKEALGKKQVDHLNMASIFRD